MQNTLSLQSNQASAGAAVKSVLGTVNSVAVAVGSTFDIVTDGVGMAHRAVQDMSVKQADRSKIEMHLYRSEIIAEAGLRKQRLNDSVREYVGTDTTRQEEWKNIEAELTALFADKA